MSLDQIHAHNMRKLANRQNNSGGIIDDVLKQINEAAEIGDFEITITDPGHIMELTEELRSRGFEIDTGGRYNEVDMNIKWK